MINHHTWNILEYFKSHTEDEVFETITLTIISVDEFVSLHIPLDLEDAKKLEAKKQNIIAKLVSCNLYSNPKDKWTPMLID